MSRKKQRTPRQLQAHIHYVQRSLNLAPGMAGQWSREAQDVLDTWLLKDVKGMQKKNMLALEDKPGAEPSCSEAVESQPKDDNIVEEMASMRRSQRMTTSMRRKQKRTRSLRHSLRRVKRKTKSVRSD